MNKGETAMIYLDNSATTFPDRLVITEVCRVMGTVLGNPSSRHSLGLEAQKLLSSCRKRMAKSLGVLPEEVYFTSGGTESDNIAVMGGANIKKGRRIVTTAVEHPAVLECMKRLEEQGFEVIYLKPRPDGVVPIEAFREAITPQTCLVSVMAVNNETGAIMPVDKIKPILAKASPRGIFHVDAVQAFGHIPMSLSRWGVDAASISGHKIHAPKGIGVLYVRKGTQIKTPSHGGGQERGMRSGTENLAGIAGITVAAELISPKDGEKISQMRQYLKEELLKIPQTVYNGPETAAAHILNISFAGIRSEIMLNALNSRRIYVSSASACASSKGAASHVLKAMEAPLADNAVRFSLSRENTAEEMEITVNAVKEIVRELRG